MARGWPSLTGHWAPPAASRESSPGSLGTGPPGRSRSSSVHRWRRERPPGCCGPPGMTSPPRWALGSPPPRGQRHRWVRQSGRGRECNGRPMRVTWIRPPPSADRTGRPRPPGSWAPPRDPRRPPLPPGATGSPVGFTATARAGSANRWCGSPATISARAGTELPDRLVVRLVDRAGNGVPNRPVSWVIGTGGGQRRPRHQHHRWER